MTGSRIRYNHPVDRAIEPQPALDASMLVGGVVVHDQVQVEFFRSLLVDALQEADEFLMSVLRHTVTNDLAIQSERRTR